MDRFERYARTHTTPIATIAVVLAAVFAFLQLRKNQAPVIVQAGDSSSSADPAGTPDLLSYFNAGASAATGLGGAAMDLAGNVVGSLGGAVGTLADSQASLGQSVSDALGQAIGYLTTPQPPTGVVTLPPAPGGPPAGGGTTPPPPTSIHGTKPAGALGYLDAVGVPLFSVSGGVAKQIIVSGNVHGWIGQASHYSPNATLSRILTGNHAGIYVKPSAGRLSPT